MTDKQIIIQYLENKGISKYKFYDVTGLSNGFLDKGSSFNVDNLRLILKHYPDLEFLLLNGNKNIKEEKVDHKLNEPQSIYGTPKNQLEEKERSIIYLEKSVLRLEKENDRLENEINAFKRPSTSPETTNK